MRQPHIPRPHRRTFRQEVRLSLVSIRLHLGDKNVGDRHNGRFVRTVSPLRETVPPPLPMNPPPPLPSAEDEVIRENGDWKSSVREGKVETFSYHSMNRAESQESLKLDQVVVGLTVKKEHE